MSRLNTRLLIPLGAGLAVLLLWYVVLWGPQGSTLSKAKKRASAATAQRETLRDQLNRLQQSRRDQPLKQAQLETLRVAIPDDPNLAQLILDTNDAASRSGVDFLSITPTPPGTAAAQGTTTPSAAGGAVSSIRISMSVTGGYFQVLDFVNRLNRLPRIVVVDALTIANSATGLQVSLQERMFTTSSQAIAGGTAAPAAGATGASTTTTTPGASTTTTRTG
jgi:Tfp pilus assembly protein PilO